MASMWENIADEDRRREDVDHARHSPGRVEAETMTSPRKDDGLWHAEDYDDEPRSHGNFGVDPQMQMMEAEASARKRAEFKREMELAYEFMRERRRAKRRLAGGKR